MKDVRIKPEVVHFVRKNRIGGNFSLEFIFEDVRNRLSDRFEFKVVICKRFSNGIRKRLLNVIDAKNQQGQINHITGDIHYLNLLFRRKNTILTILDCGFLKIDHPFKRRILKWLWLDIPVKKSKYITAISNATKSDIVTLTHCDPAKVFYIPVAVAEIFQPSVKIFNAVCPVLLQLGTASNKNIERLIEAITNIPCKLIVIGRLTAQHEQLLKNNKIKFENYVFLSQEEIYRHYQDCDIVTFVSTFEGFGMPIIEANCVERVVIAGNNTSMPEVGGDAAHYVDAYDIADIQKGIERLIQDESYRNQLIENGRKNRLRFSNQVIAEMYGALYDRLNSENA